MPIKFTPEEAAAAESAFSQFQPSTQQVASQPEVAAPAMTPDQQNEVMRKAWNDLNAEDRMFTVHDQPVGYHTLDQVVRSSSPVDALKLYLQDKGFKFRITPADVQEMSAGQQMALASVQGPGTIEMANLAHAAELVLDPAIRAVQDEFGRPLVEKMLDLHGAASRALDRLPGPQETPDVAASKNLLLRSAAGLVAGPAVLEKAPDQTKAAAMRNPVMASPVGAAMLSVGQQVGELPLFLIGPGKAVRVGEEALGAVKLAKAAPRAEKLALGAARAATAGLGGAEAGLKFGLASPSRPESDIAPGISMLDAAQFGAVMSPVAQAGARAAKTLLGHVYETFIKAKPKKPTLAAILTTDGMHDALDQIVKAHSDGPAPQPEELMFVRIVADEDGAPVAQMFGASPKEGMKVASMPLTPKGAASVARLAQKQGVGLNMSRWISDQTGPFEQVEPVTKAIWQALSNPQSRAYSAALNSELAGREPTVQVEGWQGPVGDTVPRKGPSIDDGPSMDTFRPNAYRGVVDGDRFRVVPEVQGETRLPEEKTAVPLEGFEPTGGDLDKTAPDARAMWGLRGSNKVDPLEKAQAARAAGGEGTANMRGPEKTAPGDLADLVKLGMDPSAQGIGAGSIKGGPSPRIGYLGNPKELPVAKGGKALDVPTVAAPGTPGTPPDAAADLDAVLGQVRRQANTSKTFWEAARDTLLAKHMRGPVDVATWVQSYQAGTVLQRSSEDLYQAARAKFGGKLLDQTDRDLYAYFQGQKKLDEVARPKQISDKVWQEAKAFSQKLMAEKELLDQRLASLGYVSDELFWARNADLMDQYLARRYWAYAMPAGRWARTVTGPAMTQVLEDGVGYIYDQMSKRARGSRFGFTKDQVTREVLEILNDPSTLKTGSEGSTAGVFRSLMSKKEIDPKLRKLMGEMESGQAAIAISLGTQRALVARLELLRDMAARPEYVSALPNYDAGHAYLIPDSPAFGDMAGKYTTRDIFEAVATLDTAHLQSHGLLTKALGFIKGNQVALGGVGPIINSTLGNLWSGTLSGGLDMTRPLKTGKALLEAIEALRSYAKDPTGYTGRGALVVEARRVGADFFGFGHEEIGNRNANKFLDEVYAALPKDGRPMGLWDVLKLINDRTFNKYRKAQMVGGELLDLNDRLFRMQSYLSLREKYLADLAMNGDKSYLVKEGLLPLGRPDLQRAAAQVRAMYRKAPLPGKLTAVQQEAVEAVAKLAARRVNQSFWNPTFIGPGLDKLRRSAIGFVAPYATAAFETFRVNAMLPQRLAKEPDLVWRLAAAGMVVGGAFGANSLAQHYNNIRTEDITAADATRSSTSKFYRPVQFALPWRDDKGRIQFLDLTRAWDPLRYLQGVDMRNDPAAAMVVKALTNVVLSPIEGGFVEPYVRTGLQTLGAPVGMPPKPEFNPLGADSQGMQVLKFLWSSGMLPGATKNVYEGARLGGAIPGRKPYEEPLTPGQAVRRGAGFSYVQPVTQGPGSPSRLSGNIEEDQAQKQIDKAWYAADPKNKDIRAKLQKAQEELNKRMKSRQNAMRGGKQ